MARANRLINWIKMPFSFIGAHDMVIWLLTFLSDFNEFICNHPTVLSTV